MSRSLDSIKGMWVGETPMSSMGLAMIVALVFGVLLCSGISTAQTAPPPANTTYTIKDLGEPYLGFNGFNDVNDSGQVAGYASIRKGNGYSLYAFLYSDGQMQDLGTLGGTESAAYGVNDSGQVVGWSRLSTGDARAFLYSGGQMQDLGTLGGHLRDESVAFSVNDSGQVVGYSRTFQGVMRAFLYSGGQMQDLGTLGGDQSEAMDINDSGQVVGGAYTSNGENHAFLHSGGQMQDLGTFGGRDSFAFGVNDSGQVVGGAYTSNGEGHAFLHSGGQMQDLGTLGGNQSEAMDINDSGQVVGEADISTSTWESHAFLYSGGQMQDLNDLLPADSGWELLTARAINSSGQILGIGTLNGQHRAFLATPTQAPQVMSTVPAANATAVDPATNVTATFSEEMDASSINSTTFKLFRRGSKKEVAASVRYDAATHTATLDPTKSLQKGVSYNAVVTTGAKDLDGNPLEQEHGWSFTVRK